MKLYVNGELKATSTSFDPQEYDISNQEPLKIGSGETASFSGRIRHVRLYNRKLNADEVGDLFRLGLDER